MRESIELELSGLNPILSRYINSIIKDLEKIKGFEVYSVNNWKSNLPTILPTIGSKLESEIVSRIDGLIITINDQKLRTKWSSLD